MTGVLGGHADLFVAARANTGVLGQLWRRRVTFAFVFLLILGMVISALLVLPRRYEAAGTVIIGGVEPLPGSGGVPASVTWEQKLGDPADLESNLLLIVSPRLLRQVVASPAGSAAIKSECDAARAEPVGRMMAAVLPPRYSCEAIAASDTRKLEWVQDRYGATSLGRSRLIAIGYRSPIPEVAQQMANLLIKAYLDDERARRVEPREAGVAWLQQEIAQLAAALQQDEKSIEAFRRSHGLLQGQYASISSERLTQTSTLLAQAQAAQAAAAAQLQAVGAGGGEDAPAVLGSRTIADLKQQAATIGAQLAHQSQVLGPNNPSVAALQRERDELQGRLTLETARIRDSIQRSYAAATAQVAELTDELAAIKRDAGEATDYEAQIASLVRDMDVKRTLFVGLSQQASQLQTEREVQTATTQLVSLAEEPIRPAFPKPTPFLVGGVTLGGILATAAALRRDKMDRRLRTAASLQALTGLAVLAHIPAAEGGRLAGLAGQRSLPLTDMLERLRRPSMLQESVRGLYARLTLEGFGNGSRRTLLVTSADEREGKTFVALALAQFAAANGRRVLLIECDLRRPSLQAALVRPERRSPHPGLTEYLAGTVKDAPVVQLAGRPGLDVVLAGEASIASTELLTGPYFGDLLRFAQDYDLVLLDSPPCELLMDACVIASRVDGVLFCARRGHAEPERVASSLQALQQAGGSIAGLVLTFAPGGGGAPYGVYLKSSPKRLAHSDTLT